MEVKIVGWACNNIRGGLRGLDVELGPRPARWVLIQMPNGTGKTTTMELFRAALSEERMDPARVRSYRSADADKSGSFELRVLIDGALRRITVLLDYEDGSVRYTTARAQLTGGGTDAGVLLPSALKQLFKQADFVRLFVFDGELASQIRDLGTDRALKAIKTLYRLDQIGSVQAQIERLVDAEQTRVASKTIDQKGITRWKNAVATAEQTNRELHARADAANARIGTLTAEIESLELQRKERIESHSEFRNRSAQIEHELQEVGQEIYARSSELIGAWRVPSAVNARVLDRLRALGTKLDRLKLPQTMSKEFFFELAEAPECVCGRPITPAEREAILERSSRYLAENQIGVINAMKSAVRTTTAAHDVTRDVVTALVRATRRQRSLHQDSDRLKAEAVAAGDLELQELDKRVHVASEELGTLRGQLERLEARSPSDQQALGVTWQTNVVLCEAHLEDMKKKLAAATQTQRFYAQAKLMNEVLSKIVHRALDLLRERVRQATNAKLLRLVPSEALRVARIDGALVLESAGQTSKHGVSEGQSLAVAYAFLASLFEDAPYRLPFVVDSPAVSLDTQVRREVAEVIPMLFDQMLMFVISSERVGFAESFYARDDVRYITIERTGATARIHEGREAFNIFHDDSPSAELEVSA